MSETKHFFNAGFGWTCRRCHEATEESDQHVGALARFFTEGEAEAGDHAAALTTPALARWLDASRSTLVCPRCHSQEIIEDGGETRS